jgi:hypothetical protein
VTFRLHKLIGIRNQGITENHELWIIPTILLYGIRSIYLADWDIEVQCYYMAYLRLFDAQQTL